MTIECPHCGGKVSGYRKERDYLALELGRCTACGKDKTAKEIQDGRWRCAACRRKYAARAFKHRHGAGLDDAAGVYRPRAGWK